MNVLLRPWRSGSIDDISWDAKLFRFYFIGMTTDTSRLMTKPSMACAPSEASDQPGHPPSLVRVFAVRMKKARVFSYLGLSCSCIPHECPCDWPVPGDRCKEIYVGCKTTLVSFWRVLTSFSAKRFDISVVVRSRTEHFLIANLDILA